MTPQPLVSFDKLMAQSTAICNRLPRELRDMTYDFILDDATFRTVHDGAFPRGSPGAERIILPYSSDAKYWPAFVTPRVVNDTFRVELVERFRKLSGTVTVRNGQDLHCLLNKSLFQTRLCYAQIALSKMVFDTSFHSTDRIEWDPDVLTTTLAPILQGQQKLANNFTLVLNIHTDCVTPARPSKHELSDYEPTFLRWVHSLRYTWPIVSNIKRLVQKPGTKRTVQIWIKMARMPHEDGP